ncbi:MAG: DUF4345 domain-containing protein [Bacteroidota bacterium]
MEIIKMVILALSALLLIFVGSMRLINPIKTFLNSSGIQLNNDVNLLNEMRGISAVMLCGGILIGLGIVLPEFRLTSFTIGSLIFLGFVIGRLISISADGKPNQQITQGIVFEIVLGAANVLGWLSLV